VQKIRIMIAGIRRTSFQAFARILERASNEFDVIEQAWGEAEALKLLRESDVDIVLVDASVPEAFELCGRLTQVYPNLHVVLVGGRRNYEWLKRAMDAGARGYFAEDDCTGECMRAEIKRVLHIRQDQARPYVQILERYEIAGKSRAVVKAVDFIRHNYRKSISVADAAEYAGISESHLRRCFRQETGLSFVDFLTKYRIDAAKAMMDKGDMPIHVISETTGFSSPRYFCRVFKKATNMTPREYMIGTGKDVDAE